MRLSRGLGIEIKSADQLALMREAGLVVAQMLSATVAAVAPGVSTADLDAIAAQVIRDAGAKSSFLGYQGYPATICTSVNSQIVHGIPSAELKLAEGDVLSIDAGAIVGGWHGDAAVTIGVGAVSAEAADLMAACELALWRGIAAATPGRRLTDVSYEVETSALASGRYGIVREYTGHFIGSQMHMDPPVPNYGRPGRGPVLTEGMALAIEPMLTLGDWHTRLLADDWTVVTADGSVAAHFEHTVALTPDGPVVTTADDGGKEGFARLADLTATELATPEAATPEAVAGRRPAAAPVGPSR
jgi:methionyl aminopeptidase